MCSDAVTLTWSTFFISQCYYFQLIFIKKVDSTMMGNNLQRHHMPFGWESPVMLICSCLVLWWIISILWWGVQKMKSKEEMPSMPPPLFHTSTDLPWLNFTTRGRYRAFHLQRGIPLFIDIGWVFTCRFTCYFSRETPDVGLLERHFKCIFKRTTGLHSSTPSPLIITTSTLQIQLQHDCGIPHLLTASLKQTILKGKHC